MESTPEGLLASLSGLARGLKLALEATRAWKWAYDLLSQQGLEVTLVHPYKTKAITSARIKSDRLDDHILAQTNAGRAGGKGLRGRPGDEGLRELLG